MITKHRCKMYTDETTGFLVPNLGLHVVKLSDDKRHLQIKITFILTVCCLSQRVFCLGSVRSGSTDHHFDHKADMTMTGLNRTQIQILLPGFWWKMFCASQNGYYGLISGRVVVAAQPFSYVPMLFKTYMEQFI